MNLRYPALLALFCASTAQATSVFINEIHYDNTGGDVGEFFEVAAPIGEDLTGWSVALYNGNDGGTYNTLDLSGKTLVEDGNYAFLAIYLPSNGLQNGSPDGLALVDNNGITVQFLSYEGTFDATNGPAIGLTSTDIGVTEPSTTPVGFSLQLSGTGSVYSDFTWLAPDAETPDAANNSQTFSTTIIDTPPSVSASSPGDGDTNVAIDANINLTFSEEVVISATNPISCITEASISVTISGSGSSYMIDPDVDLPAGDTCTFTLNAADVTDLDEAPDNMAEDFTISFSVVDSNLTFDLVINEFLADPAGDISGDANGDGTRDSSQDEFFELVNNGSAPADLSGWTFSDGFGVRHEFPADSVVSPGCAIVVFGGGNPQGVFGGALVQTSSTNTIGLNNGGDSLTISNGVTTFEVVYGGEGSNNQSLTRNPDVTGVSFSQHSTIAEANGALFSPGTQLDGSAFAGCSIPDIAPTVVDITPADGATQVSLDSVISLTFSEEVIVSQWPSLACDVTGIVTLEGALNGTDFTLTPATQLSSNETCTFTLPAGSVADVDGTPDTLANDFVSTFSTAELLVCASPETYTYISTIQGSGSTSPLVDQTVLVQAVVTAVFPDSNSFYIQEEETDNDGDNSTSEGVYVFNPSGAFGMPAVNDVVTVKGEVSERFNRTQISLSSAPLVCGNDTILATEFTLPVTSVNDFESLEGMLVTSGIELTVTDTFSLGRFGEVKLSNGRLFVPTNLFPAGSPEAIALAEQNELNRITLDDGINGQNPETVIFPTGGLSANNPLRGGDTVSSLKGVVDYSFNLYRVIPVEPPTFIASNPRTAAPQLAVGNLKVASLNVLNLFNGDGQGAGFPTSRGADSLLEYERQISKTVAALVAMDADIVGLMEIENDGFDDNSAIAQLTARLNDQLGDGTYAFVNAGAPIGTDEIMVALLYKPGKVSLLGSHKILNSANSIADGDGPLFLDTKNRPALNQKFALIDNGEELVVSVNHLKSKGSSCGAGDDDTSTGQGNCNLTRTRAAQALTAFLAEQYADTPTLIMGDLNAYAKEDPILQIQQAGYTDLANKFAGSEAYSYAFGGEYGYLDHALANEFLVDKVVDTTEWHINADEPTVFDYNVEFKSPQNIIDYYAPDAYRMSDHDPVVISLLLESAALRGDFDGDGDVDRQDIRALILAIVRKQPIDSSFDFNNDGKITIRDALIMSRLCTRRGCRTK